MLTVIGMIESENWMFATRHDDEFVSHSPCTMVTAPRKTLTWGEALLYRHSPHKTQAEAERCAGQKLTNKEKAELFMEEFRCGI